MLWGKHSPNSTISHVRKRPWHRATSEYRECNQLFSPPKIFKNYFLFLFSRQMILRFEKRCKRGFICNKLWHVLLQDLCHILSTWGKNPWQCHTYISESSACNVPGAATDRTEWNRLKEQLMCTEQEGACHVLAVLGNLLSYLSEHMVSDMGKKMMPDDARTPSVVFFPLSSVLTNCQSILRILF